MINLSTILPLILALCILPSQQQVAAVTIQQQHELSDISTANLILHLENLKQRTLPLSNTQTKFELGLTYSLLADKMDAVEQDAIIAFMNDKHYLQEKAEEYYKLCLLDNPSNANALSNLASLMEDRATDKAGDLMHNHNLIASIITLYEQALSSDHLHLQAHINYGFFLRHIGRHREAATIFNQGLNHHPNSTRLKFEVAITNENLGEIGLAESMYQEILATDPNTLAQLNLGGIYHKLLLYEDAIHHYSKALSTVVSYEDSDCFVNTTPQEEDENLLSQLHQSPFADNSVQYHNTFETICKCPNNDDIDMLKKIMNNMGLALYQMKRYTQAIIIFQELLTLLQTCKASSSSSTDDILTAATNLFLVSRAGCFFPAWDWLDTLLSHIDKATSSATTTMPSLMLPFDTLGLPVSAGWKRQSSLLHSNKVEQELAVNRNVPDDNRITNNEKKRKPRLGFLSHNFSDHPTTYLFEGVAAGHELNPSSLVDIIAYSYGPDDKSIARQNIIDRVGRNNFIGISNSNNEDAIKAVCDDRPDIIFDLQGLTLGERPQLLANRCADIQVNYLAYPGTTGASYIDFVIVDKHVAATERADDEFTEKLAILPRSYQPNYFEEELVHMPVRGSNEWKELREREGLSSSTSVFVFANLNKHDKIDPRSFSAMMTCLDRVTNSILWLLEPSTPEAASVVKSNLRSSAEKAGISPDRLVFAKKVDRMEHIRRMAAGDLFLDTFLYGAHTTATDALRGGMPLLTLAGDSFSRRVGVSLLHSMNDEVASALITYSEEEFVSVAVEIAKAQIEYDEEGAEMVPNMATKFIEPNNNDNDDERKKKHELFDHQGYTRDLEALSLMMLEVKHLTLKNDMHIVLTPRIIIMVR